MRTQGNLVYKSSKAGLAVVGGEANIRVEIEVYIICRLQRLFSERQMLCVNKCSHLSDTAVGIVGVGEASGKKLQCCKEKKKFNLATHLPQDNPMPSSNRI